MKKSIFFGAICLIAGCFVTSKVSAQKQDEAAIKKVIQQETSTYFHKNYDGWADTWLHDTAASILRAGTDGYNQVLGWNAIAAEYKQGIQNLRSRTDAEIAPFLNKTDYHIYINGNMAAVTFKEGDKIQNTEMRTLVKQNGVWKILNFTLIDNGSYALNNIMGNMRTFAGKWVLDGQGTTEPADRGELHSVEFELKETAIGFEQLSNFIFTDNDGQSFAPPAAHEYFIPDYNTGAISYMSVRKSRFGQTFVQKGTITSDKVNSFTVTIMYPDKPTTIQTEFTITLQNGKWHQVDKEYDGNGKQTRTSTLDLRRVM